MGKLLTFALILGAFFLSASLSGESIGSSYSCKGDECVVSGSSSLGSVLISLGIIVFLLARSDQSKGVNLSAVVGVWRRLGAFYIDFALVLLVVAPIATLPLLIAEASHSGGFEWSFIRKYARPSDGLLAHSAVFATFGALYLYFFYHPLKEKQTVGEYILGYKIVAEPSSGLSPSFGLRPIVSFIGLCALPASLYFALRKDDKRFWWDTENANTCRNGLVLD